ncbi:hypothetical protein [endosymbiont DhMRE of Dentiscutata heterogama]|uniref:hypothetical protein n=1 Tax=endosymbiont DhMRE of Dentiscutata heterogama TaxID=1609546 RepID=UPI002AD393D6|nr:hypothetical protein [endosymbiont DhMRE of Dentiscutata heterogama]
MTISQKEKILRNLDKICLDPMGDLANTELLKNRSYQNATDYYFRTYQDDETNPKWKTEPKWEEVRKIEVEGKKIDLDQFQKGDDFQEIRTALINEIKENKSDWKVAKEGETTVVVNRSGRKHWKEGIIGFGGKKAQQDWTEIETALKNSDFPVIDNSPNKSNPTSTETKKRWYKPNDYPFTWTIGLICSTLLAYCYYFCSQKNKINISWHQSQKKKKKTVRYQAPKRVAAEWNQSVNYKINKYSLWQH